MQFLLGQCAKSIRQMSRSEGESLSSSLSFDSVSVCVLPSSPSDCSLSVYGMGTATFLGTKAKGATGASSGTQSLTGQSFRVLCITKNKEQNTKLPRRSVWCFRVCSCPSRSRARAAGGGAGVYSPRLGGASFLYSKRRRVAFFVIQGILVLGSSWYATST